MPPHDEAARLDALKELAILDTAPEPAFDAITRLLTRILQTPIGLISLIDRDRQWFKSRYGLSVPETPREQAFCNVAIESGETIIVTDARQDSRFKDNPLVVADPKIRFYAGAPLITKSGFAIGTVCVIDGNPRDFTAADRQSLQDLATLTMYLIDARHAAKNLDPHSGLPNRSQLAHDLDDFRQAAVGSLKSLLVLDLFHAEKINDVFRGLGSPYASELLRSAEKTIGAILGSGTTLYDLGQGRYACIADENGESWRDLIGRLQHHLQEPVYCGDIPIELSAGIGVVRFQAESADPPHLVQTATAAALQARQSERGWCFYDPAAEAVHKRAFTLLTEFRQALKDSNQLSLAYQPRVEMASGRCRAAEALLRWRHPGLGAIAPSEFIPVTQRTALSRSLTRWVEATAFAQAFRWKIAGQGLRISINISSCDLEEKDFPDHLMSGLTRNRLEASDIELEITEGVLLQEGGRSHDNLRTIGALGIQVAIDDFGTGFSNLAYLRQLPATTIKIDQSFVRPLIASMSDRAIVKSTITLAHDLGYRVVAEGVETREIWDLLAEWSCDEVQGYLLSPALAPGDLERWLEDTGRRGQVCAGGALQPASCS